MSVHYTEEQLMLKDVIREFTENEVRDRDALMDTNGFDYETAAKMAECGLMGINVPEEFGGGACDDLSMAIAAREVARGSASAAFTLEAHWIAVEMIMERGTEAQKLRYLPEAAKGEIFAFGLTESCAGSDAAGIRSVLSPDGEGGWILNGSKSWITNSGVASYYIIMAKTDPNAGSKGISAVIVPKDAPGLSVGKFEDKMGMRGSATCEICFDNIRLPGDAMLGKPGDGFKMAMKALDGGRISIAAIALGLSEHAFALAKDYVNKRVAFGKTVSSFEGIQFAFADMSVRLKAMELLTFDAARAKASGQRCTVEAAAAKLYASESATQICLKCIQMFGGNGYSREYDVERLARDAKLLEIADGTSEILRMVLGAASLKS
ncbi:MAG: acyl-CoA dehydrogenase family protein [Oscillospiraceae bacterium]|nr:acyl-CoA dehydrogenase family protein [Oscillospiraceae bacterium]